MEPALATTYDTRQFKAGNSYAVRLSSGTAYPPDTMLTVTRIGQRTIIEPKDDSMDGFIELLRKAHAAGTWTRQPTEGRIPEDFA